jgi:hypothetical protein
VIVDLGGSWIFPHIIIASTFSAITLVKINQDSSQYRLTSRCSGRR